MGNGSSAEKDDAASGGCGNARLFPEEELLPAELSAASHVLEQLPLAVPPLRRHQDIVLAELALQILLFIAPDIYVSIWKFGSLC